MKRTFEDLLKLRTVQKKEILSKATVIIDLLSEGKKEEDTTAPAPIPPPPVPPPIFELKVQEIDFVPDISISEKSHTQIKRIAKSARVLKNAERKARKQALFLMRKQWKSIDLPYIYSYLSYIDDTSRKVNARCVGGEAMFSCISKATPRIPAQLSEAETSVKAFHISNLRAGMSLGKSFLDAVSSASGVSQEILKKAYDRAQPVQGASLEVSARARVLSLVIGGASRRGEDADLWKEHKNLL